VFISSVLCAGELDPGEDKEHDAADDGQGRRAVDVPGERFATAAGRQGERGAARTLLCQHGERSSAVGRHRAGVPATDADRPTATSRPTKRQIGNLLSISQINRLLLIGYKHSFLFFVR